MNKKELLRGVALVGLALSGCSQSAEFAGSTVKQTKVHTVEITADNDTLAVLRILKEIDWRCHVQKRRLEEDEDDMWFLENISQSGNKINFFAITEEENCVEKFK